MEHRDMALKRHRHHLNKRYIEVYRATGDDFLSVAGGATTEATAFLSRGAQVIIRMRGLPYDCTAQQVLDFFSTGKDPCAVLDATEGVLFVHRFDGRATGDAFVLFSLEEDAPKALGRHRNLIGSRYIELFRSTIAEVQQVLNRALEPKAAPVPPQAGGVGASPAADGSTLGYGLGLGAVPLLPQHVITSGTLKDCVRLRGLPYEAQVEHILKFLDDFSKNIVFQGVHMVYNAQGQPSGEAFIQMDSEASAFLCAQQKHHRYMTFCKKQRYIEVFQCSGEDMNLVLTGGMSSPVSPGGGKVLPSPPGTLMAPSPPPLPPSAPLSQLGQLGQLGQLSQLSQLGQPHQPSIAQQQAQAQLIAHHSLLARQAANEQAFLAHFAAAQFLPAQSLAPPHLLPYYSQQMQAPAAFQAQAQAKPPPLFAPNPYFVYRLPPPALPRLPMGAAQQAYLASQSAKRSYESAFAGAGDSASSPKRAFPGFPPAPLPNSSLQPNPMASLPLFAQAYPHFYPGL